VLNEVNGLPTHVLLVHAVVVLVPMASAAVIASAWSAPLRRRLGALTPLLALAVLVLVPITANAGEWLRDDRKLGELKQVREHADLGEWLWPWVLALFVLALTGFLLGRRTVDPTVTASGRSGPLLVVAVLATVVAVGATVHTFRVGESGSRAVWGETATS
jgi:hypothetical protein